MVLSLVNTRLLVELTGVAGLAAHSIIVSLTAWLALLNFGVPSGMQNLISERRAQGLSLQTLRDTVTSLTAVGFVAMIPVSIGIAVLTKYYLLAAYPFVATWAVAVACLLLLLSSLGMVFNQMLHAEHRSVWPNVYPSLTALGVSGVLLGLKLVQEGDFNYVLALYFLPSAAVVGLAARQLRLPRRWLLDRDCLAALWQRSRGYLLASSLGTLTLGIDYAILSQLLSEREVATYNLASRFFLVVLTIHAVLLASAWTPMGEMFYRREYLQLKKYVWRLLGVGMSLGTLAGMAILALLPDLVHLLAGPIAPEVPLSLALLWWAYMMVRIWSDSFFTVLQSFGRTDILNRYIPIQALISVLAQVALGSYYGAEGVLLGIMLSFFLTCVWYLPRNGLRLLSAHAHADLH